MRLLSMYQQNFRLSGTTTMDRDRPLEEVLDLLRHRLNLLCRRFPRTNQTDTPHILR
jgi:hypothetical protein